MPDSPSPYVDISTFAIAFFEGVHRTIIKAIGGLADEQIHLQPSPYTNSVGWLAWHMSRWKDQFAALAIGEDQVWITQEWAAKFGVAAERTGQGDTPEQVASFRPSRETLLGYVEAAQQATVNRIARITPERFLEDVTYAADREPRPLWRSLVGTVSDAGQHAGQIAYLRGLIAD
jgi:uncharacterized damage-inducible protein DinB